MTTVRRFAWKAGAILILSGLSASAAALRGKGSVSWALLGWAAAALPGLVAGIVLAERHGKPGSGFVLALGAGILTRFVVVLGSLGAALVAGGGAYRPWLLGVVLGYVPMEIFEIVWFHRRARELSAAR